MRKMIWGGTALLVFGVTAIFFGARYAAMNPDSLLGRCARAAYNVGVRCNPLVHLNRRVDDAVAVGKPVPGAGLPIPAAVTPGDEHQEAPPAAPAAAEHPECVESIVVEDIEEGEAAPAAAGQTAEPARLPEEPDDFVAPPADNDLEKLPVAMPYADHDDGQFQELKQPDCVCMAELFKWLVQNDNDCTKPCPSYSQCLVQSLIECIEEVLGKDAAPAEQVAPPAEPVRAAPETDRLSGEEDQEVQRKSGTGFHEDPYFHHQYPGCPYTGPCPYPHRYRLPPVTPPVKPSPRQEKSSQRSHLIGDETHIMPWSVLLETRAIDWSSTEDGRTHPEIDTMECRPTDVPPMDAHETY
jgi:hypothetical protein